MNHVSDNSICSVYVTFFSFKFSLIVCFHAFAGMNALLVAKHVHMLVSGLWGIFLFRSSLYISGMFVQNEVPQQFNFGWLEHLFCNHMIFLNLDCPLLQKSPVCCTKPFQLLKSKVQWLLLCLLIAKNKCLMSSLQPKVNRVLLWSV